MQVTGAPGRARRHFASNASIIRITAEEVEETEWAKPPGGEGGSGRCPAISDFPAA